MFKNKKNEKTKNINNDKIKEQKNVLMDDPSFILIII